MLGGIRHLIWDTGRGLDLRSANMLSWINIVGAIALTALLWAVILGSRP
jgi:succinate dehydrogenase / fumarate reductase cytochrome b subunit